MKRRRRLSREDFLKTLDIIRQDGPKVEYRTETQRNGETLNITLNIGALRIKELWLFTLKSLAYIELSSAVCPEVRLFNR